MALLLSAGVAEMEFLSIEGVYPVQLQWGDCDPAGIIFYPTYFRWFDSATWMLFSQVGYTAKRMRAEHLAMPLVAADCEFKAPAEQQDRCEVRSRIVRWGGKSFVVRHEVTREDDTLLAQGSETRVWGRYTDGPGSPLKGQAVTEELKALFRAT